MITSRTESVSESEASSALRPSAIDNPHLSRFPRVFYSFDELEPAVERAIVEHMEQGESIRQIIVAPRQRLLGAHRKSRGWRGILLPWEWTPDWVLAWTSERVLVATIDRPRATPVVTSTSTADILSFEWGSILLHAWVEWTWVNQSQAKQTRIYFNAVGETLFKRVLDSLRHDLAVQSELTTVQPDRHLERLAALPFKFMNIIMHDLLLPDEQVQAVVYRPAIWSNQHKLFRHQRAAAMTLVLSNYHILIAEEDLTGTQNSYGLITRFYPRGHVRHAALEHGQDGVLLKLALEMLGVQQEVSVPFETSAEPSLQEILVLLRND
jgi:hypothetical protein